MFTLLQILSTIQSKNNIALMQENAQLN
jgi:hypothetical protein